MFNQRTSIKSFNPYDFLDRDRERRVVFYGRGLPNTRLRYLHCVIKFNGMMNKQKITRIGLLLINILMKVLREHRQKSVRHF